MKTFKSFGITRTIKNFTGDKIKISKILNLQIVVVDYKLEDSKYKDKCLFLQVEVNGEKRVVFTGAKTLIEDIQKVPHGRISIQHNHC